MLEHGYDQAQAVRDLLLAQGFVEVHSRMDLGGHPTHQPGAPAVLNDQELLRYSRKQILLQHVDIDGQLRLKQSRALIVGLGGLGAPVALYLAAAGVGELHLADFDAVDLTNLQRQIIHDTDSVGMSKVDSAIRR